MMSTFVPRSEMEAKQVATNKAIDELEARVEKIEQRAWEAIVWVLGAVGTAIAGAFGLHVKAG